MRTEVLTGTVLAKRSKAKYDVWFQGPEGALRNSATSGEVATVSLALPISLSLLVGDHGFQKAPLSLLRAFYSGGGRRARRLQFLGVRQSSQKTVS